MLFVLLGIGAWLYFNGAVSLLEVPDLDIESLVTRAVAVNSSAQIVVHALAPPYLEAKSLLYAKGMYTDIGSLGGSNTMAVAVNERDHVEIVVDRVAVTELLVSAVPLVLRIPQDRHPEVAVPALSP